MLYIVYRTRGATVQGTTPGTTQEETLSLENAYDSITSTDLHIMGKRADEAYEQCIERINRHISGWVASFYIGKTFLAAKKPGIVLNIADATTFNRKNGLKRSLKDAREKDENYMDIFVIAVMTTERTSEHVGSTTDRGTEEDTMISLKNRLASYYKINDKRIDNDKKDVGRTSESPYPAYLVYLCVTYKKPAIPETQTNGDTPSRNTKKPPKTL